MESEFSKCPLWKWQREAYLSLGPRAWSQGFVPSYITSNPFTAKWMATLAASYLNNISFNRDKPVTFFDLGAGSGRFSFLFLTFFKKILDIKVRYVMTDICPETIQWWREHPQLKPLECEFLLFNHDDPSIPLEYNGNPVILLANYFFNTLPCDLYRITGGKVEEGMVSVTSPKEKIDQCEVKETFYPTDKTFPYLGDGTFFMPTGALQVLDLFAKWSKAKMLLISGDQGVSNLQQLKEWKPEICRHKTFSTAVNHLAIAEFFKGSAFLAEDPSFVFGVVVGLLGEGGEAVKRCLATECAFQPKDYYNLVEGWRGDFSSLLALLKLGEGDVSNMNHFFSQLREGLKGANGEEKGALKVLIKRCVDHFFLISKEEGEVFINLGVLLFEAGFKTEAKTLFLKAKELLGETPLLRKNLLACL